MATQQRYQAIEDYGLIGDLHTVALVGKNGLIDWCCFPAFNDEARLLLEKLLSYSSHLGLYAEEISPKGGRWGIFPRLLLIFR